MNREEIIDFYRFLKIIGLYRAFYDRLEVPIPNVNMFDYLSNASNTASAILNAPRLVYVSKQTNREVFDSYTHYKCHKEALKIYEILKNLEGKTFKFNNETKVFHLLSVEKPQDIDYNFCEKSHSFPSLYTKITVNYFDLNTFRPEVESASYTFRRFANSFYGCEIGKINENITIFEDEEELKRVTEEWREKRISEMTKGFENCLSNLTTEKKEDNFSLERDLCYKPFIEAIVSQYNAITNVSTSRNDSWISNYSITY